MHSQQKYKVTSLWPEQLENVQQDSQQSYAYLSSSNTPLSLAFFVISQLRCNLEQAGIFSSVINGSSLAHILQSKHVCLPQLQDIYVSTCIIRLCLQLRWYPRVVDNLWFQWRLGAHAAV